MNTRIGKFFSLIRSQAELCPPPLTIEGTGGCRTFLRYKRGDDTFIFEDGVWKNSDSHSPVLIARKSDFIPGRRGRILTVSTGNHATVAIPLLTGRMWSIPAVPPSKRGDVLVHSIVCANVISGLLEISQRDVSASLIAETDLWLREVGLPMDGMVMAERDDGTVEHFRKLGQEWRIKPLAWTRREIEMALAASRTSINTSLSYYHSAKGVHFLSYGDFHRLGALAKTDFAEFVRCLREWGALGEGEKVSNVRMPKFHGHHEIEFFGMRRGIAEEKVIPMLEQLLEDITLKRCDAESAYRMYARIDRLYRDNLTRPTLGDDTSEDFIDTLYMHLTGEIYYTHNDLGSLAFDDRRTALPGATFHNGRPEFHPGCDERTRVLMRNVEQSLSNDELIEYANVYEIRSQHDDEQPAGVKLGSGQTREIVFKTNRRALTRSFIEKRLAQAKPGYGAYLLVRVQAFKELGVNFPEYRLLSRLSSSAGRKISYYLRTRCPGEPLDDLPNTIFKPTSSSDPEVAGEDPRVALSLAALLGDAAAQNMTLKKYIPDSGCRFGIGKEIYELGFNTACRRMMPVYVMTCSARGSLGWPDLARSEENLNSLFSFYASAYAGTLHKFWLKHSCAVSIQTMADQFMNGFEFKTRAMHWCYMSRKEQFEHFKPQIPSSYGFADKWDFALWALDALTARMGEFAEIFIEKVREAGASHK